MKLTDFDAISLDCYGTLIDWEGGMSPYLSRLRDAEGQTPGVEALLATYAIKERGIERDFPRALYPEILSRTFKATGAAHGIDVATGLATAFGASVSDWTPFPDTVEALQRLSKRFKLYILSNIDRASYAASDVKLGVTFDAVLTAEDIGSYKPDPRNFEALFTRVSQDGIAKDRLLHVAQSVFHDQIPAKELGLSTVWINRPSEGAISTEASQITPNWTFPSMNELADAVDAEAS